MGSDAIIRRNPATDVWDFGTTACATGELIYDLACELGLEITPRIAKSLYAAILTDTGSFRFSNTTPRSHAVAADLLSVRTGDGARVALGHLEAAAAVPARGVVC